MMPEISVVIPVYNSEKNIRRCIESLLSQTFIDYEIIVVDDGSNDGTAKILQQYSKNNKVSVITVENGGVSNARNQGISACKGKYIGFVDSDDFVDPRYLEVLYSQIIENNADLSIVGFNNNVNNDPISFNSSQHFNYLIMDQLESLNKTLSDDNCGGYLWNKLFRTSIIKEHSLKMDTEVKIWEDMLFCIKYEEFITKAVYTNIPLYHYIQYSNSALHSDSLWREYTQIKAIKEIYDISKKYPYNSLFSKKTRDLYCEQIILFLTDKRYLTNSNRKLCIDMRNEIIKVKGNLSVKHRIRIICYKVLPYRFWKYI